MYSKSLLIAVAAFMVTASGAQAFSSTQYLERAGFSRAHVEAISQARDLKQRGKHAQARDLLLAVGIDEEAVVALRELSQKVIAEPKVMSEEEEIYRYDDALRAARQSNDKLTMMMIEKEAGWRE